MATTLLLHGLGPTPVKSFPSIKHAMKYMLGEFSWSPDSKRAGKSKKAKA